VDWVIKITEIKAKLLVHGLKEVVMEIELAQQTVGTPSENFSVTLNKLIEISLLYTKANSIIHKDLEELTNYAKSLGYL
jgi:hypothetical protein